MTNHPQHLADQEPKLLPYEVPVRYVAAVDPATDESSVFIVYKDEKPVAWMSAGFKQEMEELQKGFERRWRDFVLFGYMPPLPTKTPEQEYRDTLKWGFIYTEDGERHMLMVSNEDMKAYRMNGYELVEPLEEVPYKTFDRWARGMDL